MHLPRHGQGRNPAHVESIRLMLERIWPAILLLVLPVLALGMSTQGSHWRSDALEQRESRISRTLMRASQFVDVPHISSLPSCADVQPPEALTTPDPLFTPTVHGRKARVSFIIGTDGRVHSPLILESAGL